MTFEIYTDGSCKAGRGSWAFVVVSEHGRVDEFSGFEMCIDSNRMELRAAIEALKWLPPFGRAIVRADSRILIDGMTTDMAEWKARGWLKTNHRPPPNLVEWRELDFLSQRLKIDWKWIRAHSGNVYNERCDELCIRARLKPLLRRA